MSTTRFSTTRYHFLLGSCTLIFLLISSIPTEAGGWLQRSSHSLFRNVKRVGQEVIERPARHLFGSDSAKQTDDLSGVDSKYNAYTQPPDAKRDTGIQQDFKDVNRGDNDMSLDSPYNRAVTDYNRNSKISTIIGLLRYSGDIPITLESGEIKERLQPLSNRQLTFLYYGLLELQEKKFIDGLAVSIAQDLRQNRYISGGFAHYPMRSLQLEKINNFFAADSTGKIHVKNDIKIPPRIASFWIQLIARDGLHHPADESIFPIAKTIGRDGWLIHFNRSNQLMGTSFFTMEGQVINCGLHRVSIDRANN